MRISRERSLTPSHLREALNERSSGPEGRTRRRFGGSPEARANSLNESTGWGPSNGKWPAPCVAFCAVSPIPANFFLIF